ncbi:hypothetical protein KSP40_PGU016622 [Platanthera guangdongensis]|uniref:Uncharacterized protein n=1 Tax=Platanthera guangdongensis TaxID=2320717 RepID=A0ABR2ML06_9ASPA
MSEMGVARRRGRRGAGSAKLGRWGASKVLEKSFFKTKWGADSHTWEEVQTITQIKHIQEEIIFDGMPLRKLAAWNEVILASADHGEGKQCFRLFNKLRSEGFESDSTIIISILRS